MRAQGYSTDEIAHELRIRPKSVHNYVYLATKSGFLINKKGSFFADPKDSIEFELSHKAVRNMNEFLDSKDIDVRKEMTLEIAKGSLFKRFDQPKDTAALPSMQVLAIKIDMPTTGDTTVREGSIGGIPIYEGTVDDSGQRD